MVTSNSKCIRQARSSRKPDPLIQLITRGYSIWKPYVKWESNLILLRLAAQLVDGQKLTRGPAIYLIGPKIRVCISLLTMELCSFMPPGPPHGKWRHLCKTFPQLCQALRKKPHTSQWKSCLRCPSSHSCMARLCACLWQAHKRQPQLLTRRAL